MFLSRSLSFLLPSIACLPLFCNLAEAQSSFSLPFSAEEELSDSDRILDDGSFYDTYTFDGAANQSVTIYLRSFDFDTYLILIDPNGNVVVENDDSNRTLDSSNSLIEAVLPMNGIYSVLVNSYASDSTGNYSLESDVFMSLESGGGIASQSSNLSADELRELALESFTTGDYWSAADSYSQIIQRGSPNVCDYFMQGNAEYLLGNYEGAVRSYSEGINLPRDNPYWRCSSDNNVESIYLLPELAFNAGNAYLKLGNYQQAIAQYNYALRFQFQFPEALYNRAIANTLLGRIEEASSDFEGLVQLYDVNDQRYDRFSGFRGSSGPTFTELDSSNLDGDIFSILIGERWKGTGPPAHPSNGGRYNTAMLLYRQGCQFAINRNYNQARSHLQAAKNRFSALGLRQESNQAQRALNSNPIQCPN